MLDFCTCAFSFDSNLDIQSGSILKKGAIEYVIIVLNTLYLVCFSSVPIRVPLYRSTIHHRFFFISDRIRLSRTRNYC